MDFIGVILGRYILEFLGTLFRYIYLNIGTLIKSSSFTPFSKVWHPKGNIDKKNENSTLNFMIGLFYLV